MQVQLQRAKSQILMYYIHEIEADCQLKTILMRTKLPPCIIHSMRNRADTQASHV